MFKPEQHLAVIRFGRTYVDDVVFLFELLLPERDFKDNLAAFRA